MITSLTVRNFRTLHDITWEPKKLSILVGPNNSGKTNLAYALRFLSATARTDSLDKAGDEACGTAAEVVCRRTPDDPVLFRLVATVPEVGITFEYILQLQYVPTPTDGGPTLRVLSEHLFKVEEGARQLMLARSGDKAETTDKSAAELGLPEVTSLELSAGETVLSRLRADGSSTAARIKRFVATMRYYRISPDAARLSGGHPDSAILSEAAGNLSAALFRMKNEDDPTYGELLRLVKSIDPSIAYFNCIPLADKRVIVEVGSSDIAETMALSSMSDGTLLYLAFCMVALQPRLNTRRELDIPSVVILEEPENGLYVRNLHPFVDILRETSKTRQTIITTHNPFLLDFFDDAVEDIFVLGRGDSGTEIRAANPEKVDRLLEVMSMGEMLYRGLLACE